MKEKQLKLFDLDDFQEVYSLIENEFLPDEYFEIEYKSAQGGFPKEFWKSYSAFANTNTGFIILGIKEKNGEFTIEGLDDDTIQKYQKNILE